MKCLACGQITSQEEIDKLSQKIELMRQTLEAEEDRLRCLLAGYCDSYCEEQNEPTIEA